MKVTEVCGLASSYAFAASEGPLLADRWHRASRQVAARIVSTSRLGQWSSHGDAVAVAPWLVRVALPRCE